MNYLLIETSSCDEARYCGAYIHGEYGTLDEACAALHEAAAEWGEEGAELTMCDHDEWKPGYCSDDRSKYADEFWEENDLTAWRGMCGESGFVRLEIFGRDEDGEWHSMWL